MSRAVVAVVAVVLGATLLLACGEAQDPAPQEAARQQPAPAAGTAASSQDTTGDTTGDATGDTTPAPTSGQHTSAAQAGALVFKEHRVTDPGMGDTVIATLLVPEGWTVEGGATRPSNMLWNMPVVIDVRITAPDGRTARFSPSLSFEFNHRAPGQLMQPNGNGNLYYPLPESPGQWLMELAQANPLPGVSRIRLVSEQDIPEITQTLRQQNALRFQSVAQLNQTTAPMGFSKEYDTQATQVVMRYEKDGKQIEVTIVMTWNYEVQITQGRVTEGTWGIQLMQSIGGPVGTDYIDDPALNAIFQSVRNNPVWMAEMQKYWAEIARIRHKGVMDSIRTAGAISQIQAEGANAVNDIMMKGWRAGNASSDTAQARTVDGILEQTVYGTPDGGSIELPSFYDHVLTDGNGRYLLHNDALYEPNLDPSLDGDWQRIEARR